MIPATLGCDLRTLLCDLSETLSRLVEGLSLFVRHQLRVFLLLITLAAAPIHIGWPTA